MFTLRTERLLLRPFLLSDATAFAEYRSDPEVARLQSWSAPYPLESARQLISEMQGRTRPRPGEWNQIAICLADNALAPNARAENTAAEAAPLIGDCAFKIHADDERQASIGFTLGAPHQRRGYATEAVRALLNHLFTTLHLHRVTAQCDADNLPSRRVLERLGMRREAHFIQNNFFKGAWTSECAYALLRSNWRP